MPKPSLYSKNIMVIVWWSPADVIHYSFPNPGQTIDATKYCTELYEILDRLLRKKPALVKKHGVIFLHNNIKPHVSSTTVQKLHQMT